MMVGGGIFFALSVVLVPSTVAFARPSRILGASAFLTGSLAFLLAQPFLYGVGFESIWRAALEAFAGYTTGAALFVSAMLLLAAWHAFDIPLAARRLVSDQLLLAFAVLLVAYLLVYFIFTGYVHTGYFLRYLPLTIYLNNLLLALGLVAMIDCVYGWYALSEQSISLQRMIGGGGVAVAGLGLFGV